MPRREPDHFADLPFPDKGLDVSGPINEQPPETTRVGQNVRTFEAVTNRQRGGSRPGLGRYINARVNGISLIQDLNYLVTTSEGAVDSGGGGFQPQLPTGISFLIDFVRTASGFTLTTRIEQLLFARSATTTNAGSILGALTHPPTFPADYTTAADGFKIRVTAVDQLGASVSLDVGDVDAALHTSGAVTYLGTDPTTYAWTRAYTSNPGTTTYTVTVELLDSSSASIAARSADGTLTGGGLTGTFTSSTGASQLNIHSYPFRYATIAGTAGAAPNEFGSFGAGFNIGSYQTTSQTAIGAPGVISTTPFNTSATLFSFNAALTGTHTDGYAIGTPQLTEEFFVPNGGFYPAGGGSVDLTDGGLTFDPQIGLMIVDYYGNYGTAFTLAERNALSGALRIEAGGTP